LLTIKIVLFVGRIKQHGLSIFVLNSNRECWIADNSLITTLNGDQFQN